MSPDPSVSAASTPCCRPTWTFASTVGRAAAALARPTRRLPLLHPEGRALRPRLRHLYRSGPEHIAALAAHLDATRAITRHGVASAAETLQAFSALPPPSVTRSRWQILGLTRDAVMGLPANVFAAAISEAWRSLSRETHSDAGGDEAAQAELNAARAEALKEITP